MPRTEAATATTTIVGVDFSGAKDERNTWASRGFLAPDGALRFESVQPVLREDLFKLPATVPPPAVAALDSPFGVRKSLGYPFRTDRPSP